MRRKVIGLRYCGGCNPTYERVHLVRRVQKLTDDRFRFGRYDEPNLEGLLLVNGCRRACADEKPHSERLPSFSIVDANEIDLLLDWLNSLREVCHRSP